MKKSIFVVVFLLTALTIYTQPLNDIIHRTVVKEKPVLTYPSLQENDIMWEKRIWRVLDVREKMNQPFAYPGASLFEIMVSAAKENDLILYSTGIDDFSIEMSINDLNNTLSTTDTIMVFDPVTYTPTMQVIHNDMNPEDIKRYRIKEVWFFDNRTSTMRVRILGIAPMIDIYDANGTFRYEKPLFWIHYPSSREAFSRHLVFNTGNDGSRITWEDLFEMRQFSSYVYKESNIGDYKLDQHYTGTELLLNAEKIEETIFNYEHDLWSY